MTTYVVKSATFGEPTKSDLAKINAHSRRELLADEVYVFSAVLCDNEIDRDFERFTREALAKLAVLFVGKSGILDHEAKSENQMARTFECEVKSVRGKKNTQGEPYCQLVARSYIFRCEKNRELIEEIDAGIKKEVSVSCAVTSTCCSLCGADVKLEPCKHKKGRTYGGQVCHAVLLEPTDAYEWSFVAVPAQKAAGVIKSFKSEVKGGVKMEKIIKKLENGEAVTLTEADAKAIYERLEELERLAGEGKAYREQLCREVVRLCGLCEPGLAGGVVESVAKKMTISELQGFKKAFSQRANEVLPPRPQLASLRNSAMGEGFEEFKV